MEDCKMTMFSQRCLSVTYGAAEVRTQDNVLTEGPLVLTHRTHYLTSERTTLRTLMF